MSSQELVQLNNNTDPSIVPLPESIDGLPHYFAEKHAVNSSSFKHFELAATQMVAHLDEMAGLSRANEAKAVLIPVNPGNSQYHHDNLKFMDMVYDQDAYKIPEGDKAVESQAFMDLVYHLTPSEELFDTRRPGTASPDGFVVTRTEYDGAVVFLVENHLHLEEEGYMLWSVASSIPEAALEAKQDREVQAAEAYELGRLVTRDLQDLDNFDLDQLTRAA